MIPIILIYLITIKRHIKVKIALKLNFTLSKQQEPINQILIY